MLNECFIEANNMLFPDPCPGNTKYLDIYFTCEKYSEYNPPRVNDGLSLKIFLIYEIVLKCNPYKKRMWYELF